MSLGWGLRLSCLLMFNFIAEQEARLGVNPKLMKGSPYHAGLYVQLTQKGLNHVNELAKHIVSKALPEMKIPDVSRSLGGNQGHFHLTGVTQRNYKKPDDFKMKFVPDDKLEWGLFNMNIGILGHISGEYVVVLPIKVEGDLEANIYGIQLTTLIGIKKTIDGKPKIWCADCEMRAERLELIMHHAGIVGDIFNMIRADTEKSVQPKIFAEVCRIIRHMIDTQGNDLVNILPLEFPLASVEKGGNGGLADGLASVGGWILKGLWLDMRFLWNPNITEHQLLTHHHGEVSWQGLGKTPFFPIKMNSEVKKPDKMLYLYASDYLVNSAMYHSFRNGALKFNLKPEDDPQAGVFLATNCNNGFFDVCIGDLIPQLSEFYPKSKCELGFHLSRAPALIFANDTILFDSPGSVFLYVRSKDKKKLGVKGKEKYEKKLVMSCGVEMKGSLNLDVVDGKRVAGELSLTKFKLKLRNTVFPALRDSNLEELGDMSTIMVETVVNQIMGKGMPIPAFKGVNLHKPRLKIMDRMLRIETDLQVDPNTLKNFGGNAFG